MISLAGKIALDYRLSPQHTFPAAIHDMVSGYMHLIDPPAGSGLKKYAPSQVFFCGDSAGGNLALTAALWIRDSGYCALPAGLILLSPWVGFLLSSNVPLLSKLDTIDGLDTLDALIQRPPCL